MNLDPPTGSKVTFTAWGAVNVNLDPPTGAKVTFTAWGAVNVNLDPPAGAKVTFTAWGAVNVNLASRGSSKVTLTGARWLPRAPPPTLDGQPPPFHLRNHDLHAILACVQVSDQTTATPAVTRDKTTPTPAVTRDQTAPTAAATPDQTPPGATPAALTTDPAQIALAGDLYALVVHLHKNCNSDLFEAVGALELSLTQIKLLHQLEDASRELTLKEGAELVHVSFPAASRMVDDLVRRGFVDRHEDVADRRMKRIHLTEAGRSVIRRLNAARLIGLEGFVGGLSEPERAALAEALSRMLEREEVAACRPEGLER